jgi:hypothetical protein
VSSHVAWKCVVCEAVFPPHTQHSCPYTGVGLRKKLDAIEERLGRLEKRSPRQGPASDPEP